MLYLWRMGKLRVKNRNDTRYLNIQKTIDRVLGKFVKHGHVASLKVSEVTDSANIFASTFYDHHKNLDAAIRHLNHKMKRELDQLTKEATENKCSLIVFYTKLLYLIAKNKNYYDIAIKTENIGIIMMAIRTAEPFVIKEWSARTKKEQEDKFFVFSWRAVEEIWWWGEQYNFDEEKIAKLASRLVGLTRTINQTYIKML